MPLFQKSSQRVWKVLKCPQCPRAKLTFFALEIVKKSNFIVFDGHWQCQLSLLYFYDAPITLFNTRVKKIWHVVAWPPLNRPVNSEEWKRHIFRSRGKYWFPLIGKKAACILIYPISETCEKAEIDNRIQYAWKVYESVWKTVRVSVSAEKWLVEKRWLNPAVKQYLGMSMTRLSVTPSGSVEVFCDFCTVYLWRMQCTGIHRKAV